MFDVEHSVQGECSIEHSVRTERSTLSIQALFCSLEATICSLFQCAALAEMMSWIEMFVTIDINSHMLKFPVSQAKFLRAFATGGHLFKVAHYPIISLQMLVV